MSTSTPRSRPVRAGAPTPDPARAGAPRTGRARTGAPNSRRATGAWRAQLMRASLTSLLMALVLPTLVFPARPVGARAPEGGSSEPARRKERVARRAGPDARAGGGRRLGPAALERLLRKYEHEPTVEKVQAAAVRLVLAGAARPRTWLRRSGRAAWLPTLQLGVGLQQRRDRGLDREAGVAPRLEAAAMNQIAYEIKMSWDLPRLIFDPNALRVVREAQRIAELREQVVLHVTRLYYERRRLQLAGELRPVTTPQAALRRALRLAELTAVLNAMTGGLFGPERAAARPGLR